MASQYRELPLTFEKGLVQEVEESILDDGQASEITNWEPTPQGGLRARNAWSTISTDGLTSPYSVRGFGAIATGTAVAGIVTGPQIVAEEHWPDNAEADAVATKTLTLTSVSAGNVLIAVVTDDSDLTPSVTAGWTQRAVSAGDEQHVKFYTKTAVFSSEDFTYTISQARIRSMDLYEVRYLDSEDPGDKWAAQSDTSGTSGSDNLTVTATDTDGGFALVGYLYNGGTPNTSSSGTSGYAAPTLDNANTRTGVSFEDLDQLDGSIQDSGGASWSYTSPSWTPPTAGIIICLFNGYSAGTTTSLSASGNGLTWHSCTDGGELGIHAAASQNFGYVWADASQATGTTGAITISGVNSVNNAMIGTFHFVKAIGGDTTDPFVQQATNEETFAGTSIDGPTFSSALQNGSGVLGLASGAVSSGGSDSAPIAQVGTGDWESTLDSFDLVDSVSAISGGSAPRTFFSRSAYASSSFSPDTKQNWQYDIAGYATEEVSYEIRGSGNAAKTYHDTLTGAGTVVEGFSYLANQEISAKMVVWGYTAPETSADAVDFFIVTALATDSTTYTVYQIQRDAIESGTWEQIDQVTDASSTNEFVSFAQGAGHLIWTASSMSAPRAVEIATTSAFSISDLADLAGRAAVYHKDRMFIAGSAQNPSRVYFSDIGEPTDFTIATDYLDIGGDDGEAIQDLLSVEGLLLIPKTNRSYLVSGSGVESFFNNELPGGTSAPGRTTVRTPFGTVLAGDDDVWVVQGGGVDPLSRPLGSGYTITGVASTAYAQDVALITDTGSANVWRVNLVTGAWSLESVTGDDASCYIVWSLNGRFYYGTNGSTTQVGGTRKLSSLRNVDETTGDTAFSAATGRMALDGPSFHYTPRYLYVQARAQDTSLYNQLRISVTTNINETEPFWQAFDVTETTTRYRMSLAKYKGAEWIKIGFAANSSETASAIDVEKVVLGVDVEAPR